MAKTTLKAKKYYDWHDVAKRFGFNDIKDVFDTEITSNGCLCYIFDPKQIEEDLDLSDKDSQRRFDNQKRIFNEIGECKIYVWW